MAATKTKAKPKTTARSKSKPKSARSNKSKSKAAKSKPKRASGNAKRTAKAAGASARKSTRRKGSGGGSLEKLKGPATATGAALLAVAGLAATRNRNHRSALLHGGAGKKFIKNMKRVNLPSADEAIDWVEEKSKGVGDAGYKVAEMTSQARKAKKVVSR